MNQTFCAKISVTGILAQNFLYQSMQEKLPIAGPAGGNFCRLFIIKLVI